VDRLYCEAVDVRQISLYPPVLPCTQWYVTHCDTCGLHTIFEDGECQECGASCYYEIFCSSFWPLPTFFGEDPEIPPAEKWDRYGICFIRFNPEDVGNYELPEHIGDLLGENKWGFALTCCGMDMSWDICGAYVAFGYYPPSVLAKDLPKMAGPRPDMKIVRAAEESLRIHKKWMSEGLEHLKSVRGFIKENCTK